MEYRETINGELWTIQLDVRADRYRNARTRKPVPGAYVWKAQATTASGLSRTLTGLPRSGETYVDAVTRAEEAIRTSLAVSPKPTG